MEVDLQRLFECYSRVTGHNLLWDAIPCCHHSMEEAVAMMVCVDPLLKQWVAVQIDPGRPWVWPKYAGRNGGGVLQNSSADTQLQVVPPLPQ